MLAKGPDQGQQCSKRKTTMMTTTKTAIQTTTGTAMATLTATPTARTTTASHATMYNVAAV